MRHAPDGPHMGPTWTPGWTAHSTSTKNVVFPCIFTASPPPDLLPFQLDPQVQQAPGFCLERQKHQQNARHDSASGWPEITGQRMDSEWTANGQRTGSEWTLQVVAGGRRLNGLPAVMAAHFNDDRAAGAAPAPRSTQLCHSGGVETTNAVLRHGWGLGVGFWVEYVGFRGKT